MKKIINGEYIEKLIESEDDKIIQKKIAIDLIEKKEIEKILLDLHNIGSIIYFNDNTLKDIIVTNPVWFNKVIYHFIY